MPRRGRFSINRSVLRLVNRLQIAYLENISLTVSDLAFVGRGQCFPGRPPAHRSSPKGHCRGSRFSAPVQLAMLLCSPGFAFSSQRWGPRGAAGAGGCRRARSSLGLAPGRPQRPASRARSPPEGPRSPTYSCVQAAPAPQRAPQALKDEVPQLFVASPVPQSPGMMHGIVSVP